MNILIKHINPDLGINKLVKIQWGPANSGIGKRLLDSSFDFK